MREEKQDRRSKLTKLLIKESLIELLKEKDISKITITEICEKADINRGTFYLHYYDTEECLSKIEDEFLNKIKTRVDSMIEEGSIKGLLEIIFQEMISERDTYESFFFWEIQQKGIYFKNNRNGKRTSF